MNALVTSLSALAVILGGAFGGMWLRKALPGRHLAEDDTKDVVRLGTGLIGTISALVLGLLIAAANSSYDTQSSHIQHMAADIILLDQLLVQYGPEAEPARAELRQAIDPMVKRIWRESQLGSANRSVGVSGAGQDFAAIVLHLAPQNEAQRIIKDRAIQTTAELAQTRFLLFEQSGGSLPLPFLVVLVFWLAMIFASFGMFARPNPILIGALVICAVSAAGALFLVLELGDPFTGLMQISSAPLRNALGPL